MGVQQIRLPFTQIHNRKRGWLRPAYDAFFLLTFISGLIPLAFGHPRSSGLRSLVIAALVVGSLGIAVALRLIKRSLARRAATRDIRRGSYFEGTATGKHHDRDSGQKNRGQIRLDPEGITFTSDTPFLSPTQKITWNSIRRIDITEGFRVAKMSLSMTDGAVRDFGVYDFDGLTIALEPLPKAARAPSRVLPATHRPL